MMEYFEEFHWWYVLIGIVLLFLFFGKSKGGMVKKRVTADLAVLDERFAACITEADYSIFKEGSPDHIEIEVEQLPIEAGEELAFELNGETLALVTVNRKQEAEFDHWSDEGIDFPVVKEGDVLVIKYQGVDVFKGAFR